MDETTLRRMTEEQEIKSFLENNRNLTYACTFLYISPENLDTFQHFFPELLFEPSFNGCTFITFKY